MGKGKNGKDGLLNITENMIRFEQGMVQRAGYGKLLQQ